MSTIPQMFAFTPSKALVAEILKERGITRAKHKASGTPIEWDLVLEVGAADIRDALNGLVQARARALRRGRSDTSCMLGNKGAFNLQFAHELTARLLPDEKATLSTLCMRAWYTEVRETADTNGLLGDQWRIYAVPDDSLVLAIF